MPVGEPSGTSAHTKRSDVNFKTFSKGMEVAAQYIVNFAEPTRQIPIMLRFIQNNLLRVDRKETKYIIT